MNEQDKQLLLKDLSARLHYGVKAQVLVWDEKKQEEVCVPLTVYSINTDGYVYFETDEYDLGCPPIENCLYYLRPMSSMTDEEIDELTEYHIWNNGDRIFLDCNCELGDFIGAMEWFNKHHFDYRGLIEMGLALEAPEGMYEIK